MIDAGSGAPLEGAIVVARWEWLESRYAYGGPPYQPTGQTVHAGEAVTGGDGRFAIAAWGPVKKSGGVVDEDSPRLLAFKPGYEPLAQSAKAGPLHLKKFSGAPKAYATILARFQERDLWWTRDENSHAIPNMALAMHRERTRLGEEGQEILGVFRMPGRNGEGKLVDEATGRPGPRGVIWIEWTMRRSDSSPGTRQVVQTLRPSSFGSSNFAFFVSPWRPDTPKLAAWEVDLAAKPLVRVYPYGYQRSQPVRWEENGGTIKVKKLDESREALLAELRARRKDIDAQLAVGDRAQGLLLQRDMLDAFDGQCSPLTPDLRKGLCFDPDSDLARAVFEARHQTERVDYAENGMKLVTRYESRHPVQATVAMPASPRSEPTRPVGGFTIEPVPR